jgi:2-polyprenyl-3-methyl-5-hydroxy-6-metoxy-1,4-benzoquinol methylase
MHYDPIKEFLGRQFNRHPILRKLFYLLLNILLLRSWHVRKALRKLSGSLPSSAMVLDAGMGFGQYTWWMTVKFPQWNITAADIKSEQVADCTAFFKRVGLDKRVKTVEADLVTWKGSDKYDLILCVDVMEHIEQDNEVFTSFCNMIGPGGYLVISTPSDMGGSDVHSADEKSFIDEHVRDGYSSEEITYKLHNAGFAKISVSYTYGPAGNIAWRLSMKYPVIMLSISKLFIILLPFYYLVIMFFVLIMNLIDQNVSHNKGTGLLVIAENKG